MEVGFRIRAALRYVLKGRHRKGFGIHSPFVFNTLNDVVYETNKYYCYDEIEKFRRQLVEDKSVVCLLDKQKQYRDFTLGEVVRRTVEPAKYAQLLFRLAVSNHSKYILELGTCVGLSTLYLSAVDSEAEIYTFEYEKQLLKIAQTIYNKYERRNIHTVYGDIDDTLSDVLKKIERVDFAFVDANHTKEATLRYYQQIKEKAHENTIIVFDDIWWSKGMNDAWKQICCDTDLHLALDLYRMGVVWFKPEIPLQRYTVAY